jgi:hypothetical protein
VPAAATLQIFILYSQTVAVAAAVETRQIVLQIFLVGQAVLGVVAAAQAVPLEPGEWVRQAKDILEKPILAAPVADMAEEPEVLAGLPADSLYIILLPVQV